MSSSNDSGFDHKGLFLSSTLLVVTGFLGLAYLNVRSGHWLLLMSFASLLAGMFLEIGSVTKKWKTVWALVLASCFCSLFIFIPSKDGDVMTKIQYWPLAFCFFFTIMTTVIFENRFLPKLDEGFIMLQSMGLIYWILDLRVFEFDSLVLKIILVLPIFVSLYSVFHAFSYSKLNRSARLLLSIWSAILMLAFATDNYWALIFGPSVEEATGLGSMLLVMVKYFLTGASLIYVVQSFFLFIPRDDSNRPGRTIDLEKYHIERVSELQVHRDHSLIALVFSITVFGINFYYGIVPRQIAIWSVIISFPLLLSLYVRYVERPKRTDMDT